MLGKTELIVNCCCQIVPASLRLAKSSIDIIACLGYLPLYKGKAGSLLAGSRLQLSKA